MATVRCSLKQVKKQFKEYLNPKMVLQVCDEQNYTFRRRLLGPVEALVAFCLQVLHENTSCNALRHWLGVEVSDAAYCQARQRLPVRIFKAVLYRLTKNLHTEVEQER